MDDPYFDHRSAKRFDRQRASGPFGVDELLPKKVTAWVSRKHPDSGKKQVLLNFVDWQRGQAARILSDFELYVYEWTLTAVKFRESLDKQDKRDVTTRAPYTLGTPGYSLTARRIACEHGHGDVLYVFALVAICSDTTAIINYMSKQRPLLI